MQIRIQRTFSTMQRASGLFGLVMATWALLGSGVCFFWMSTSAKLSLSDRISEGAPLQRWILSEAEWSSLGVADGEFWLDGQLFDIVSKERLVDGSIVVQVFDDSFESAWAKWGRKLFRRTPADSHPPAGLQHWVFLHAVIPSPFSMKIEKVLRPIAWTTRYVAIYVARDFDQLSPPPEVA